MNIFELIFGIILVVIECVFHYLILVPIGWIKALIKWIMKYPTTLYRSKLVIKAFEGWIKPQDKVFDLYSGTGIVTEELRKHFKCHIDTVRRTKYDIVTLVSVLHHSGGSAIDEAFEIADTILIFDRKPSFWSDIIDIILNLLIYRKFWIPHAKSSWGAGIYRQVKTPFWYPFKHFAVKKRKGADEKTS